MYVNINNIVNIFHKYQKKMGYNVTKITIITNILLYFITYLALYFPNIILVFKPKLRPSGNFKV